MEPGERSRSFAHDAAERHALPTEPEHLRQPGQLGNAGVVGDPRPQRVLGECGDELVAGRSALAGRLISVEAEAGDLPHGRPSGDGTITQMRRQVTEQMWPTGSEQTGGSTQPPRSEEHTSEP